MLFVEYCSHRLRSTGVQYTQDLRQRQPRSHCHHFNCCCPSTSTKW